MSDGAPVTCSPATSCGPCGGRGMLTFKAGLWKNNPISVQILGICSALAVTNRLENALVMGLAVVFVTTLSNLFISLLRKVTPLRIRMIVEVGVIATFVIVVDQCLQAFYWPMYKQLGPYVGLIITNCIIMGRAEAFALHNKPAVSVVDGFANGVGYAMVLAAIGLVRELLGNGSLLGYTLFSSDWYTSNLIVIMAPGAFFVMGFLVALFYWLQPPEEDGGTKR